LLESILLILNFAQTLIKERDFSLKLPLKKVVIMLFGLVLLLDLLALLDQEEILFL
jgi:hypothetical protein